MLDFLWNLISGNFSELWGYIAAGVGAAAVVIGGYLKGRSDMKRKIRVKNLEGRVQTMEEVRKHEQEAESQDDQALVDRLTRKR